RRHTRCLSDWSSDVCSSDLSPTYTVTWFAGLSESAVPVYVGDHILGFLETGEVMLKNPTKKHFASITRQLRAWGYKTDWMQLEQIGRASCRERVQIRERA